VAPPVSWGDAIAVSPPSQFDSAVD
jgi:hypothetical protein